MCGIAAIIASEQIPIPTGAIERMTQALTHRGPDSSGTLLLPGCHLGHTRLSIIDLAGGQQPMSDPQNRFHVIFNGEIYNYRDIRRTLESRGVRFRSHSDTEVLLLAYREFGKKVVDHLNGQFAFAIWDKVEQRLFAARDRLGEKPFYWSVTREGHLLFASEIRSLLASEMIRTEVDLEAVDAYLTLNYVPPNRSIYANVRPLLPGHAMTWESGRVQEWTYWKPQLSTIKIDAEEAVRQTRHLIEQAIERQMVADVPVGAFLSGGLDSSTIVALASRHTKSPIRTFAAGFGDLINELPYARSVAAAYQTQHEEMQMDIPVAEYLEKLADTYDEPFGDSSNIPTFLISKFARSQVTVVLSGDGGDELFGGYSWYESLLDHDQLPTDAVSMWKAKLESKFAKTFAKISPAWSDRSLKISKTYRGIRSKRNHPDLWLRHLSAVSTSAAVARNKLWQRTDLASTERWLAHGFGAETTFSGIDRAVDFDLRCYLSGDIFTKVDRASMANSLETRSPFMDVELVEFVLSLPANLRFQGSQLKPLLRQSCGDLWPEAIRSRTKQGFGAPLAAWLQRPDIANLVKRVFRANSPLLALLPGANSALENARRNPQALWNLLCLGLWLEKRPACLNRLSSVA